MPREKAMETFKSWYEGLKRYGDFPAKGSIGGALVVLERLKTNYILDLDAHTTKGGSQIVGASGEAAKRILALFGETRPFVSEGGRTNRGLRGDIKTMLDALRTAKLERLPIDEKNVNLQEIQDFLIGKVREFHNRERLKIMYDPSRSTWQSIHDLLEEAQKTSKEGPVAQYLVGAKLALRFPDSKVSNESYSTADQQLNRQGDFLFGDTVFHVTVAPMAPVYEKCKRNIDQGFRVYLLVPDRSLVGARQNAEGVAPGRISVESIESFVSQNLEELSTFHKDKLISGVLRMLETYNQRVDAVEKDKSMLIEIPQNLRRQS